MNLISIVVLSLTILGSDLPCIDAVTTHDNATPYDGVKVLRVPTGNATAKLDALIYERHLTTWTHASRPNSHIDVQVPHDDYDTFLSAVNKILKGDGVVYPVEVMHGDLGVSIRKEAEGMLDYTELAVDAELSTQSWFNSYHPYSYHMTWLDDLVAAFPNNAKIVSSGISFEGRDIKGVNIFGSGESGTKPAVIWHGNVHAREWITSMTVEYLAYSLLNNYANSTEVKSYVDKYDFYIFPIVNPDGFVYSQTQERFWRKNRQTPPSGSPCFGRDLNRNWNVSWAEPYNGASPNPCSEEFKGEAPVDTREIQGLAAFLDARAASPAGAAMFVDWHSYSQFVLYPYGFDCDKTATDSDELGRLASGFAGAVFDVNHTEYTVGPSCMTLYPTSGASLDFAYVVSNITYSFLVELRDTGKYGFLFPASQIRASGEETWEGVKYLLKNMVVVNFDVPVVTPTTAPSAAVRVVSLDFRVYLMIMMLSTLYVL